MATILTSLFQYKAWANHELFNELKKLDSAGHAKELYDAIRILNHVYVVDRIFAAQLQGGDHPYTATNTPETPALDDLFDAVQLMDEWYLDYAGGLSPQQLAECVNFTFVDGDKGTMTREEILLHIVTHGGYHRGAVGRIMAQLTVAPPRDIFTRFLHEHEPGRRE
ncbi:damage-inducible protein DinB [Hahella sp. CCB-MM4]|uniref:DinB family protein n=1 Tax=Hahella sp. (strain CCB-MM4) TaxID=1926491 RepID=UPI000B9B8B13|nr:DinB family protein [Hahella sp. CCB-MM4]OZG70024.1 damage-inducible protein DinB [Hahella sp. CCB-MM4]